MFYAVYKSPKKSDTYLYIAKKDDFSAVPKALMATFGAPKFVLVANIQDRETFAGLEVAEFEKKFQEKGFYLQLPPKVESLLEHHRNGQ
ncbi:MAG: YcgL domain-containing protein [Pseudomonadota bacterium]